MNDITLKIAGQVCPLNIHRLRIQQQINEIPSARLELSVPTDDNGSEDIAALKAAESLVTGVAVEINLDNATLFHGYLHVKQILLQGKQWSVRIEARHILQKLTFFPHSRVFRDQDDATILDTLFQQGGVKLIRKATTQLATRHDQMVQFRASDWQFVLSRLFAANCWLVPNVADQSVTITPLSEPATATRTLERYAQSNEYSLYEVDLTFDNRFTPDNLSLQGWDITEQKLSPAQKSDAKGFRPWKAASAQAASSQQKQDYHLAFSAMPETMLSSLSRSWINHQQLTGVQGRIVLNGTLDFRPGESVKLNKFGGGLDGTALITGVNQLFNIADGWRSELRIGMPARLPEPVPTVQSLHLATVVEFTADPQSLDRIPVYLPALNLPGEFIFARLGKPWASKASGFCFYPEVGDELVVGFIESDPRYPVILDSLHNPKNSAPFPPDKKNNNKGLVVHKDEGTEQLLINTEENTITLSAGKNSFRLTNDSDTLIETPETVTFSAKVINYQASDTLSLEGKSKVEITSASINMKK